MINLLQKLTSIFNRRSTGELKVVTDALSNELNVMVEDLKLLNMEYVISSATGEWLDEWGSWFGLPRKTGETDVNYSARILATITKPKLTVPSFLFALRNTLGEDKLIEIYEPYRDLAKFSQSIFSGSDKFVGGDYYRHHVVDVILHNSDYSSESMQAIIKIKSAGIIVWFSRLQTFDVIEVKPIDNPDGALLSVTLETNLLIREYDDTLIFSMKDNAGNTAPVSGRQTLVGNTEQTTNLQSIACRKIYPGSMTTLGLLQDSTPEQLDYKFDSHDGFEVQTIPV